MCSMHVLALLVFFVSSVRSLSWDVVLAGDQRLEFYYNGTLTHTEDIPSAPFIDSVTYDPLHYRVLFTYFNSPTMSLSSFDLSTGKIQTLLTGKSIGGWARVIYDVVTQVFFWKDGPNIYSYSWNPASGNKTDNAKLLFELDHYCWDIAVDSCGGYIYWITQHEIERARLNGSEREVLIKDSQAYDRRGLVIDQQTQKMYWIEETNGQMYSIQSANFYGKNRTTLYVIRDVIYASSLAVSKDFIYWQNFNRKGFWQLPKNSSGHEATKIDSMANLDCSVCQRIAANYTIKEQIHGITSCHTLEGLISNISKSESAVSICHNYCFQRECNVSAEGQPTCSCKVGYSGKRCEVIVCNNFCLNNGVCSLNEEDEPVCECTAEYGGERCDVAITHIDDRAYNMTQQVLQHLHTVVRQVIKEEVKGILQFFSDKVDEYETKV